MPGLSTKTQRLTQSQLNEFYSTCRHCFGKGWIHVAYSLNEESWSVYEFLCRCKDGSGFEITDCLPDYHYSRSPDYQTVALPGYVYVHPKLNPVKARLLNEHMQKRKQELSIDQEGIDEALPF